ncbi:MAG: 2-oxoacid:acceptor oxidoreductase subunit alpha [Alphaproteobacteria bacterium]|jgi:2-oxoglutarate ferredoxin oxidoreductase subunit alpha|nr:2-oxoacid:acceptor oxidoreductase subunit alpha [Alphaproteobacteria bacterium]
MKTNDFVIKFANVNGSGSASANALFAKAIFRMGVPVAPKNIFPSNIQGLPTWFEVRVNDKGHLGRRDGIDMMVAMNPQSWDQDVAAIVPGGYLLYDSTFIREIDRDDIKTIGVPLTKLCNERFTIPRERQLFKNVAYVGALTALLDMDFEVVKGMISEQFRGKDKAIAPNIDALNLGREYALKYFDCPLDIRVATSDAVGDQILIEGNAAAGLGCVFAGATVAAWYPITPSTSVAEAFEKYCHQLRIEPDTGKKKFAIVQAEDELAAIGMAIGANWNGARAFTATSGPGISLMSEFLGLAYFAEVPVLLFNIQRGGPSTGMPTRTQQSDIISCAYASHGDTKHVLLFPSDPTECFDFAMQGFDLSDGLQTPVIVMSDLDLGMNDWTTAPFKIEDGVELNRGKVLDAEQLDEIGRFGRYLDVDGDGIPYRTYPGTHPEKGAFFTRGTSHDEYAVYTEDGKVNARVMRRLSHKFETAKTLVPAPEFGQAEQGSTMGLIHFGTTAIAVPEAMELLADRQIHLDTMRLRAFPFSKEVEDFIHSHEKVFVVEQNRDAQMRSLLVNECGIDPARLVPILNFDGFPITAVAIADMVTEQLGEGEDAGEQAQGGFAAE